ncbi:MAG TPA: hypothetical protein DEP42_02475 [Ruminococcaceae bacterium]|nr:hypothetical protein [Oscillospiraceae bacterium]
MLKTLWKKWKSRLKNRQKPLEIPNIRGKSYPHPKIRHIMLSPRRAKYAPCENKKREVENHFALFKSNPLWFGM